MRLLNLKSLLILFLYLYFSSSRSFSICEGQEYPGSDQTQISAWNNCIGFWRMNTQQRRHFTGLFKL